MSTTPENKVLIVGAGPGGLALAQMLRGKDIQFEVFERDATLSSRKQGWAIALMEYGPLVPLDFSTHSHRCLPEFEPCLPDDLGSLHEVSVNYGANAYDSFCLIDGPNDRIVGKMGAVPRGQPGYVLRANRELFRQHLLKHLDVKAGKCFDRYEQDRDGITVHFKDGTSARGAMLVGADGGKSPVRSQLLGAEASELIPSRYIPIMIETILTREQYETYNSLGTSGVLANDVGLRYMVGKLEVLDNGDNARYYACIAYAADDPVAEVEWLQQASKHELYEKALEKTAAIPPRLTEILRIAGPEGVSTSGLKFVEWVPPVTLPRGRVTLLGDAAHTMIPFRGAGANTAVSDGCLLAKLLVEEQGHGGVWNVDWVLQEYERVMLSRGRKMVLASRAAGDDMMAPMAGRINRLEEKV